MELTGHRIKNTIKAWELKREALQKRFNEVIYTFPSNGDPSVETKQESLLEVSTKLNEVEAAIAKLQEIQSVYNMSVDIKHSENSKFTLCEAIKRIGGAVRMEKLWKKIVAEKEEKSYYSPRESNVRNKDAIYARLSITDEEAMEKALFFTNLSSVLKSAIAEANTVKIEMDVNQNLFQ